MSIALKWVFRSIYILEAKFYLLIFSLFYLIFYHSGRENVKERPFIEPLEGRIAIESGKKGWSLLEKEELLQSAKEFFGKRNVYKISVDRDASYLKQVEQALSVLDLDFYLVCPRTPKFRSVPHAVLLGLRLSWCFQRLGITPLVQLTDWEPRRERHFAAAVTSLGGITTMTVRPSEVLRYFATSRLIGPQLMALSNKTFDQMRRDASNKLSQSSRVNELVFYGTPYSPRKQMLTELQGLLSEEGITINIHDKRGDRRPISNREYWNRLLKQDIVIVTGRQEVNALGAHPDVAHVEWRFTEALAAGCAVLSPRCPGLEEKMRPEIDFMPYSNMEEAADLIKELSLDSEKRVALASAGRISLQQFLASGGYWRWVLDSFAN